MRRIALVLVLAALSCGQRADAQEPPTAIVVFDGSGSMWGKADPGESKAKFVLAREALRQAFTPVPSEARLGLLSFGHRRSGDCSDVETIVKAEAGTAERIGAALDRLNPKGRGPITAALREAAKELGPQSAQSSIILIHDDLDNCQGDPCSVVGELRRAHPKVAVHVVSIGLKREDAQKMQCLAKPTGGTHHEVGSAQAAGAALDSIVKAALLGRVREPVAAARKAAPEAEPVRASALPAPPDKSGLQLAVSLVEGGPFLDVPVRWRITPADNPNAAPVYEATEATPFVELPVGVYQLEAQYGFVVAKTKIDYASPSPRAFTLPLGAGTIRLTAAASAGQPTGATVTFARTNMPNEDAAILRGVAPEVAVVPGSYAVTLTAGPTRIERHVTVAAGQRVAIDPPLDLGEVEIQVLAAAGGALADGAVITIFEDDPDAPLGRREVLRSAANGGVFALSAGTYSSTARLSGLEIRDRFAVKVGEREHRTMVMEIARLSVAAKLPGRLEASEPISLRLERVDDARDISQANRGTATFVVSAGRYRLEARTGYGSVRVEREVDLRAGAREETTFEIPAGGLQLRMVEAGKTAPVTDVSWEVLDRSGRVIWLAHQTEARPILAPGRYTVRGDLRGRQVTRDVEVRSGEISALEMPAP